eukprot:2808842-Amphidinium_carterae.1
MPRGVNYRHAWRELRKLLLDQGAMALCADVDEPRPVPVQIGLGAPCDIRESESVASSSSSGTGRKTPGVPVTCHRRGCRSHPEYLQHNLKLKQNGLAACSIQSWPDCLARFQLPWRKDNKWQLGWPTWASPPSSCGTGFFQK